MNEGGETMNIDELKKKFESKFPEASAILKMGSRAPDYHYAATLWQGYKTAYEEMGKVD